MLDNLIELLLNNFVFVLVAIGGIISFLKRMGSEEEKQKSKPAANNRQQSQRRREQGNTASGRSEYGEEETPQSETVSAYQEALGRMAKRENRYSENEIKVQKNVKQISYKNDKNLSINKKNVRDGIIWSEILGPPRSKKPHPSMISMKQMKK
ncbi:hypothetical protein [Guptibacillus hwajinpoensis]|uniref:hypothetical protein n=1 Tax=Guptibacillus hwajinpoensis TaxID=208199 RepID=UPI00273E621D|nr:hypothetical protein [Pseudalkalibacillus hwajinpoensis]WLR60588.1 hypothetical protein LC071_04305 [Pseudalkalibacillus hwajinpoensis]